MSRCTRSKALFLGRLDYLSPFAGSDSVVGNTESRETLLNLSKHLIRRSEGHHRCDRTHTKPWSGLKEVYYLCKIIVTATEHNVRVLELDEHFQCHPMTTKRQVRGSLLVQTITRRPINTKATPRLTYWLGVYMPSIKVSLSGSSTKGSYGWHISC